MDFDASIFFNLTIDSSQLGSRKRVKARRESGTSFSTRRIFVYDPAFEQHLNDHGIYKNNRGQKPSNWAEINKRLAQSRSSLSPSLFIEVAFEAFQQTNKDALIEATIISKTFPIIAGTPNILSQKNFLFGNLKHLIDDFIIKIKLDFYDKSCFAKLDKQIWKKLDSYIVLSTNIVALCVPNFYIERKDLKENISICRN